MVALPGIVLAAASGSVRGKLGAGLTDGLAAGLAFGILLIGLAQAAPDRGPLAGRVRADRHAAARARRRGQVTAAVEDPGSAPPGLPALAGASGMAATLAYFYAAHFSMLAVAAVLVSLYPGVTVLLARLMLHERFSPAQRAGLGLCALAIIAIALN